MATSRRFIDVEPEMHGEGDPSQRRAEVEINGRVVNGIAPEHEQRIDLALLHGRT